MLLSFISFGSIQFRVAEAMAILPYYSLNSVAGLFVGCLISNILGGFGILGHCIRKPWYIAGRCFDVLYRQKKQIRGFLALIPPVLVNAVFVGFVLAVQIPMNFFLAFFTVAIGQTVVCYGLGIPLMLVFEKYTYNDRDGFRF